MYIQYFNKLRFIVLYFMVYSFNLFLVLSAFELKRSYGNPLFAIISEQSFKSLVMDKGMNVCAQLNIKM